MRILKIKIINKIIKYIIIIILIFNYIYSHIYIYISISNILYILSGDISFSLEIPS